MSKKIIAQLELRVNVEDAREVLMYRELMSYKLDTLKRIVSEMHAAFSTNSAKDPVDCFLSKVEEAAIIAEDIKTLNSLIEEQNKLTEDEDA